MGELVKNSLEADAEDINVNIKRTPECIEITVQDDGRGMDEQMLKKVQEKPIVLKWLSDPTDGPVKLTINL